MSAVILIRGARRVSPKLLGVIFQHQDGYCYSDASVSHDLDFGDHRTAFKHKELSELIRALVILRACGSNFLVDNCLQLFQISHKICGEKVVRKLLHPTVYTQFVAGCEESDVAMTAKQLRSLGLHLMIAPTVEEDIGESSDGQNKYDNNLNELLHLADMTQAHGGQHSCLQTKITALLSAETLKVLSAAKESSELSAIRMVEAITEVLAGASSKVLEFPGVNTFHQRNLFLAINRLRKLGASISSKGIYLLIDAEYSYVNPGCSLITLAMMAHFNNRTPVIGNTYQCYFKDAIKNVTEEFKITKDLGVCFAAKVVRGAYLEKERRVVPERLCASYSETGDNYNRAIDLMLKNIVCSEGDRCLVIIATHNEESVQLAVKHLQNLNIISSAQNVAFAQIYGMAEQISMPLCHAGYIVYKSTPVGPLAQVMPYLARRLAENRSVLQGARKERELLQQEIKYRLKMR